MREKITANTKVTTRIGKYPPSSKYEEFSMSLIPTLRPMIKKQPIMEKY